MAEDPESSSSKGSPTPIQRKHKLLTWQSKTGNAQSSIQYCFETLQDAYVDFGIVYSFQLAIESIFEIDIT